MNRASPSALASLRATGARIALALMLTLPVAVRADDAPALPDVVIVPIECVQLWTIPGGLSSPAGWDALLSFAACIQDASVSRVEREEDLAPLVEGLHAALAPSLQLYMLAFDQGPDRVKLRAAYYVALGQVALITRARSSIASPALRAPLETLLAPHAKLAYLLFTAIDDVATSYPALASDAVARNMVRSARELAKSLRSQFPRDEADLQAITR